MTSGGQLVLLPVWLIAASIIIARWQKKAVGARPDSTRSTQARLP